MNRQTNMIHLTEEELKVTTRAVRGSLDLARRFVSMPYVENPRKMKNAQARLPVLKSALKKLQEAK